MEGRVIYFENLIFKNQFLLTDIKLLRINYNTHYFIFQRLLRFMKNMPNCLSIIKFYFWLIRRFFYFYQIALLIYHINVVFYCGFVTLHSWFFYALIKKCISTYFLINNSPTKHFVEVCSWHNLSTPLWSLISHL